MNSPAVDTEIIDSISQSTHLNDGDKNYLLELLPKLSPIEKLKLKHSLLSGSAPSILINLQSIRKKFQEGEAPKPVNPISKALSTLFKPASPQIVSNSFLNQPVLLGGVIPHLPTSIGVIETLNKIGDITSLDQLKTLNPSHVNFTLYENIEYELQNFYHKTTQLFEKINDINERRNYFLNFLSSPLFKAYINTGLTALRHPELQPTSIILNTMYQIDPKYLNGSQFKTTSNISGSLRALVGL
jgi:hypothetical protein